MSAVTRTRAAVATATVALAGVSAAAALAVPPPPSSHFKGKTSQAAAKNHRVRLATDAAGRVSKVSLGWQAQCRKKGVFWKAETSIKSGSSGLPMDGDVFHQAGSYTSNAGGGITGKVTISMKGHFVDRNHAKGSWNAKVTVMNADGKVIDKCKVTGITWKVARTA